MGRRVGEVIVWLWCCGVWEERWRDRDAQTTPQQMMDDLQFPPRQGGPGTWLAGSRRSRRGRAHRHEGRWRRRGLPRGKARSKKRWGLLVSGDVERAARLRSAERRDCSGPSFFLK